MKNIIRYTSVCLLSIALASCQGFLDEDPKTQLSESSVYSTEEILEAQMNGIYAAFHGWGYRLTNMYEFFECGSSLTIWSNYSRATTNWLDQRYLTKYSDSSDGNQLVWKAIWPCVNRCNRLIDNIPGSPVDESYKTEIEAEAKCLRAITYFDIVRHWGDVPLFTKSPAAINEVNAPRTAYYKIYWQILDDLNFAEENMRSYERQESINPECDRLSKYAATAFKASVYLQIASMLSAPENDQFWDSSRDAELIAAGKDPRTPDFTPCGIKTAEDAFKLALAAADKVIEEGPYSLAKDYRQLFRWEEHEDFVLPEAIFRLQISQNSGNSANIVSWLAAQYAEGTLQVDVKNNNAARTRVGRWAHHNFMGRTGGSLGTGTREGLYVNSPDPRYSTSIRTSYTNQNDKSKIVTYPDAGMINVTKADANAYIWKYINPTFNANTGNAAYYWMRFAEMYLISAEAAAWLSSSQGDTYWNKAIERVNVLRDRAARSNDSGILDEAVWSALEWKTDSFENVDELRMGVWWERFIELAFEGHEWFDTHRFGATWLSENITKPQNRFLLDNEGFKTYTDGFFKSCRTLGFCYPEDVQDLRKSLLCAYPQTEVTTNPALPGYPTESGLNEFYWQ